jgi:hypothetical protein
MMKFKARKTFVDQGIESRSSSKKLGTNTVNLRNKSNRTSNDWTSESASPAGMQNTSVSAMPIEVDIDPLLKDIVFSEDLEQKKLVYRLYRDIYYNDPVAGSAVDLMSTLPFSDFTLGGVSDKKALSAFVETIERLNIRTILPDISTDFLVTGNFIGSLLFNATSKKFIDIMPHQGDNAKVESLPLYSQDPIITVAFPESTRALLADATDSVRIRQLRERLGPDLLKSLSEPALELDPVSTIFLPRRSFSTGEGTSWFRRILPIYLIEKNLFRGTLVESSRRQRGILHLTLGDGDQWEPTIADMDFMTDLFNNADADPLGAIIATRIGVSAEELRQGGDFWKVTDIWDSTAQFKLRAMGISEAFLSGEANYATADTGLTVFIDYIRAYRDMLTRKLFYNKLFPLISLVNGFTVNKSGKLIRKNNLMDSGNTEDYLNIMQDGSKLLIPNVHWAKQLKPEGDMQYMDMLQQLTEKGVPVPLRAMAAAGGFNLDSLLADGEDDEELLKRVSEYRKRMAEINKKYGPKVEEDASGMGGFASDSIDRLVGLSNNTHSDVLATNGGRRPSLSQRDYGDKSEITDSTKTGKKKWVYNQKSANERANRNIEKALKNISKNKSTPLSRTTSTSKK